MAWSGAIGPKPPSPLGPRSSWVPVARRRAARWHVIEAVVGLCYLVTSLACSVWYVSLLYPSFANDRWWAGFNVTGHEAFLIDLLNGVLAATMTASTLNVLAPSATVRKSYAAPDSFTKVFPTYARRTILTELTSIAYAVPQLRTLSASWSMRMNVQHCYVDFAQVFEVAHTLQRQARCKQVFASNAAVYMEATLRNVIWADFVEIWGGETGPFAISIQQPLLESAAGTALLASIARARHSTSIADEIRYWKRFGLRHFQLQWQNRWQPGISETILLQNALGMQQLVTLKNLPRTSGPWTSLNLYWMPLNDIWNGHEVNRSMVRGTSTYFGANISAGLPAIDFEVLNGNTDASGVFAGPAMLVRSTIGPFLSVDCILQEVPPALLQLYMTYQDDLFADLLEDASAMALFTALPSIQLSPLPVVWTHAQVFYGGNPMCTALPPTSYVQQSFDFFDDCSTPVALQISPTPMSVLFARALMPPESTAANICALTRTRVECVKSLAATLQLLDRLTPPSHTAALIANVTTASHAMQLSLMQFATAADGSWTLLQQPLLDGSHFSFFGWLLLLDWVAGVREVVSFQGDAGNVTLISNAYAPQLYPTGTQPLETATKIVLYLVNVTSMTLLLVGLVVLLLAGHARLHFVGRNLLYFNRIVGGVWIGRPLVFLRGSTAVLLLSSANISLTSTLGFARFVQTPRPWLASAVICGEATWLTYVANEVLLVATQGGPRWLEAAACGISWLVLLCIDARMPVQVATSLDRSCFGQDMDYAVACTSGTLVIGSLERVGLVLVVQGLVVLSTSLVLGYLTSVRKAAPASSIETSLHLSGIAQAYVQSVESLPDACAIDLVACVLSGLLPLCFRGISYTFDIKLWVLLQDSARTPLTAAYVKTLPRPLFDCCRLRQTSSLLQIPLLPQSQSRGCTSQWLGHLRMAVGLGYIVAAIASSLSYLQVSRVNLANDLFWATFNVTGHHAFFANWLNEQLVLGNTSMPYLLLNGPSLVSPYSFAALTAVVTSSASYGAYLQHEPLSELAAVIQGLRHTDGCDAPWIFVPYCYLDFGQRWQLANSAKRQLRCAAMAHNGAVYLESVLRNIDVDAFHTCWGDAFEMGVANELLASSSGTAWMQSTLFASQLLLDREVALWRQYGIRHYKVQWQNYKLVGVMNRYSIANAYGIVYPMTLTTQNGAYRLESQTSFKMYWALANDLHAVTSNVTSMAGKRLVRSSATFAFANTSLESIYMQHGTLSSPLPASLHLVQSLLGSFGSIDTIYVPVPVAVRDVVASLIELSRLPLANNRDAQAMYMNITPLDVSYSAPRRWLAQDLVSYGGSPLCASLASGYAMSVGLVSLPSFDANCFIASGSLTKLEPTRQQYIVSALLATLHEAEGDFATVCAHEPTFQTKCQRYLRQTVEYLDAYMLPLPPATALLMPTVTALAKEANISFMIYTYTNATASLSIETLQLLDDAELDYRFFAWLYLYDWVLGNREVISFVGDLGHMTLLSDHRPPLAHETQAWQVTANVAQYLRAGVAYVTSVLLAVSIVLILYILLGRGHCEGFNMLELGRVGGVVWVGRPLLVVRSMTAICVLSTANLELQHSGYMSSFATVQDPWYKTLLAANEVTWLVSIVNDVSLVVTQEHSAHYVVLNGVVVVVVVAALTTIAPVRATATIDLQCGIDHVDWHVLCDAGSITIGDVSRLRLLIGIVFLCNLVCFYAVQRSCNPAPNRVTSLFLSSGAKYLYRHDGRSYNGVYYLDRASAALDGILSIRVGSRMYSIDIKSWRPFVLDVPQNQVPSTHPMAAAFHAAYPLLD